MSSQVNKSGTDWLILRGWLNTQIDTLHKEMEQGQTLEDYHFLRGNIAAIRAILEHVEPTAPPETREDDYGISTPGTGQY